MAAYSGVAAFASLYPEICNSSSMSLSSSSARLSPSCMSNASNGNITTSSNEQVKTDNSSGDCNRKFSYSRASPAVRWPHLKLTDAAATTTTSSSSPHIQFAGASPPSTLLVEEASFSVDMSVSVDSTMVGAEKEEALGRPSKNRVKKMTKLALKRAKDWRERVKLVSDRILGLEEGQLVGDVLDDRTVQMTPTDFCFVVKWVGQRNWERALEVYEWLNLRHWYSPNARMLATVLAVLGKANQEGLAGEMFMRAEPTVGNTVQVYNAMMGVYARNGKFSHVQQLLDLMRKRGCEPDLVSLNTLINARFKAGAVVPNLAMVLLNEVRMAGLRPDIITYNTLISACSRELNLDEAMKVYHDMEAHGCQPDLWTYNAMISVYGRCGLANKAEQLFKDLESKGLFPDAVTYNSLLYAFAREGDVERVKLLCQEMLKVGFVKDEMTYNTIIHMYGKQGHHDLALQIYKDMNCSGQIPDVITYTVLIDSLGKANKITEAANIMSDMLDAGVQPTLRTYSALICGYAKAGKQLEAEETFSCMLRSGIRPDHLAYSVMLDIFLRFNEMNKAMMLYKEMVTDGYVPDNSSYEGMIQQLKRENKMEDIKKVVRDMEQLCSMNPPAIFYLLVKGQCYEHAAKYLKLAISSGYELDRENLLTFLTSYIFADRHSEARYLLEFLREHTPGSSQVISEALIVMHCKTHQQEAALQEYCHNWKLSWSQGSCAMYESLIQCCNENELLAEASQLFSDMRFCGVEPSECLYRIMVTIYCKLGFPETAYHVVNQAENRGIDFENSSIYVDVVEAYGKVKLLEKAESIVGNLRQRCETVDQKVWNALIRAYAHNGCYERARAVFDTMMRDGPFPTVHSINGLLQGLIVDGRLDELYVLIQELQDLGFKISRSSILLILDAFVQAGNIFEVKKIYNGMKAVGYFPTMHLYRIMIKLLCKGKRVRDVEVMISEMEEAGFEPDLSVWNSLLRLYTGTEDFKKTAQVYQRILETGFKPDEITYNTLIVMYCRDHRPEEGLSLMNEMKGLGLDATLDTYKSLISAFGKKQLCEQAEQLFEELLSKGCKLDRSFYHTMMKIFRNSGNYSKAEKLLSEMEEAGVEPTIATMHMLMVSYGSSGHPQEAEKILSNLKESGMQLSSLPYSSVVDAYLRKGDYNVGIRKLLEMKNEGLEPDHRIWTCLISAASLSQHKSEAIMLLNALQDAGCDIPLRLLMEKSESLVSKVDKCLERLEIVEDNAAFNFVNALENLLWAFECRATASWVFQLAIKRNIYHHDVFRVADKDWGADFRKLSGGSALVGLTLWLDHMQDASLEGYPESPKSVVLITGTAEYNRVSLEGTLKAFLWEMGSPFLPCKTRSGVLVAKAHSLRMWLKESSFCFDLELRDAPSLPEFNSMQLVDACFIRRGLVPAFNDITQRIGHISPKKFARFALLPDEKRERAIQVEIDGNLNKTGKASRRKYVARKKHLVK